MSICVYGDEVYYEGFRVATLEHESATRTEQFKRELLDDEGYHRGYSEGYDEGREHGYELGYDDGYNDGQKDAE